MRIAREEIFGPIASVIAYDSEDDAIRIANSCDYGLHGAVFSADEQHALSVARLIESGSVGVNRFGTTTSAPFGGIKCSGVGREHGPEGYDSFLEYVPYTISPELARTLPGAGQPRSVSGGRCVRTASPWSTAG
jgi:betaine-aldehyde dehydrogenase